MIKILTVGKLKNRSIAELSQYYLKQVPRKILEIEIKDEPQKNGMLVEAEAILNKIKEQDFVITLEIEGKSLSSEEFASNLNQIEANYNSDIVFVIGGSYGLHEKVKQRSNLSLSFSKMTFPHQLMKIILIEQIYRAYSIIQNHPYHK